MLSSTKRNLIFIFFISYKLQLYIRKYYVLSTISTEVAETVVQNWSLTIVPYPNKYLHIHTSSFVILIANQSISTKGNAIKVIRVHGQWSYVFGIPLQLRVVAK